MNRIVIQNYDYDPCSGGIKVLHYLAAIVAGAGAPVATTSTCFFDPTLTVVGGCDPDDIVVYPEIVRDNPMGGKRIVRYLLYYPRWPDYRVPKSECPVVYMREYLQQCRDRSESPIAEEDIVEVPNIEDPNWCFPETKTIVNLLYTGKQTCPIVPDIPFTPMPPLNDPHRFRLRYQCLSLMRKADNLYTMDHYTVLEREAVLCGCRVFRVHGKADFREVHDDPEPRCMRPQRDRVLGEKFIAITKKFFNL